MNIDEWADKSQAVKALHDKINAMIRLFVTVDLGEDARPCSDCDKLMVPYLAWQRIPPEDRTSLFAAECTGTGMCASCAGKERAKRKHVRLGGPLDEETVQRLRAAVNFPGKGM